MPNADEQRAALQGIARPDAASAEGPALDPLPTPRSLEADAPEASAMHGEEIVNETAGIVGEIMGSPNDSSWKLGKLGDLTDLLTDMAHQGVGTLAGANLHDLTMIGDAITRHVIPAAQALAKEASSDEQQHVEGCIKHFDASAKFVRNVARFHVDQMSADRAAVLQDVELAAVQDHAVAAPQEQAGPVAPAARAVPPLDPKKLKRDARAVLANANIDAFKAFKGFADQVEKDAAMDDCSKQDLLVDLANMLIDRLAQAKDDSTLTKAVDQRIKKANLERRNPTQHDRNLVGAAERISRQTITAADLKSLSHAILPAMERIGAPDAELLATNIAALRESTVYYAASTLETGRTTPRKPMKPDILQGPVVVSQRLREQADAAELPVSFFRPMNYDSRARGVAPIPEGDESEDVSLERLSASSDASDSDDSGSDDGLPGTLPMTGIDVEWDLPGKG